MTAARMDGTALAARIRVDVAHQVREVGAVGLATVLVGDDLAPEIYIRHKHTAAQGAGIRAIDHRLPADTSHDDLAALVAQLNAGDEVHGILVQSPLPSRLDESAIVELLDPAKDV